MDRCCRPPQIFTDQQIADERFLVFMNDLLSSGNIPGLFAAADKDEIMCVPSRMPARRARSSTARRRPRPGGGPRHFGWLHIVAAHLYQYLEVLWPSWSKALD